MNKYTHSLILILFFSKSFSMIIPHGVRNEISKSDVLLIIKEAENQGIKLTSEIS